MSLNYYEESKISNGKLPVEWQSQASLDELATFLQLNWEQRAVFYDDGLVTSRQQFLGFTGQKGLRTQNYIGTIVFRGQQLNIFPKVFRTERDRNETNDLELGHLMKNLVKWIEYCTKIDYPYISITSELEDSSDLRELFLTLYVRYVKNALDRGPFYRYEEQSEDTSFIKGKIDYKDYFTRKYPKGQVDKFLCTYSTFEFDNTLNRIIKYTCKELFNEASKANQKIIRHILMKLNEVADVHCTPHDCNSVRLSRLHKHYSIILSMSKMFLLNKTASYNVDNNESFCFLFPTEILFEGFIGGFMQHVLHGQAKVSLQASELSVFSDIRYAGKTYGKTKTM
ncbi:MAG: McrC family protein [Clostridia bacterium]|nr:McrC family protein [Clostridia bacterium]